VPWPWPINLDTPAHVNVTDIFQWSIVALRQRYTNWCRHQMQQAFYGSRFSSLSTSQANSAFYPFWVDTWVLSCNWMSATSVRGGAIRWTLTKEGRHGIICRYDFRKYTYTNRVIPIWNNLSDYVVSAETVNTFKRTYGT